MQEAAKYIREEIGMYVEAGETAKVGRLTVGLTLVLLKMGDAVEAQKGISDSCRAPGFEQCMDAASCQGLVDAWNEGDVKKFSNILSKPDMRSMDNQYLRVMKDLGPPQCNIPVKDFTEAEGGEEEEEMDLR